MQRGDPAAVTADFAATPGALPRDDALPSKGFEVTDSGVLWPAAGADGSALSVAGDHQVARLDLRTPR